MDVSIEPQWPEDVPEIHALFRATWLATYPNEEFGISVADIEQFLPEKPSESSLQKRRDFLENLPEHRFLVAAKLSSGKIIGVCGAEKTDEHNHLRSLYILPEYQGKGIGQVLFDAFLAWTDKSKKTIVHVATYNEPAIQFYQKQGFVDTGKRFEEERHRFASGAVIPEMEMELLT